MSELSPLSGEERKSNSEVVRSVDPNSDIETDQSSEAGASPHPRVLCSHFASHEIFRTFNRSREDRNNRIIAGSEDEPDRRTRQGARHGESRDRQRNTALHHTGPTKAGERSP